MRPEQAKQIIRHKGVLTIEAAAISLRESPAFLSTTEHYGLISRDQVPGAKDRNEVPRACMHALPFYRKHDVTLMSYVRMFRA